MSTAAVELAPALPNYLTDPNAVLKDTAEWRFGRAPDYSNTRAVWERSQSSQQPSTQVPKPTPTNHYISPAKTTNHETRSLPFLVQNLVKNWEIEASFKTNLADWRTVDHPNYTFAINGGPPQSAEHMLQVGTYNAIIAEPNEFYSPRTSDFASSHKTFKRMMPTFAWEVLEVYSGPPQVAFRWRHWGEMKKDYVGFNEYGRHLALNVSDVIALTTFFKMNSKGEKITAPAHGGTIDIQGVTVATVNDKVQLQKVETWFDPLEMFRQIAPKGIVNQRVIAPTANSTLAMEKEKVSVIGSDMAQELHTISRNAAKSTEGSKNPTVAFALEDLSNTVSGERPSLNGGIKRTAAGSPQDTAPVLGKEGTKTHDETIPEEQPGPKRTANQKAEGLIENTSSGHVQQSSLAPEQATSLLKKEDISDHGNKLEIAAEQPTVIGLDTTSAQAQEHNAGATAVGAVHRDDATRAQEQMSQLTAGACPFFTGPVIFGGAAKATERNDDTKKARDELDRIGKGEERVTNQVNIGAATASTEGSEDTMKAHEEMGKIGAGEREILINKE